MRNWATTYTTLASPRLHHQTNEGYNLVTRILSFSNISHVKKSTHQHSCIIEETPLGRTLPTRKETSKSQVWRTSINGAAFLWSLEYQKGLLKPISLSALLIEGWKEGHHTCTQLTCDGWHYPVNQAAFPIDPEDKASGSFQELKILLRDRTFMIIALQPRKHYKITMSPSIENFTKIKSTIK